jgi:lysozyme family protein
MTPDFDHALALVLKHEGGWSNHKADPGGATMRGITQRTYDTYRRGQGLPKQTVRDIATDELRDIYKSMYWDVIQADKLPPALALVAFDCAVNQGPARALEFLQQTWDYAEFMSLRLQHYTSLTETWPTFGRGWTRRAVDILKHASQLARFGEESLRLMDPRNNTQIGEATRVGNKAYLKRLEWSER